MGLSRLETILGQPCRVLRPTEGEASYMAFRLGRWKLLKPGAAYVLAVDYPEDQPRSVKAYPVIAPGTVVQPGSNCSFRSHLRTPTRMGRINHVGTGCADQADYSSKLSPPATFFA